MSTEYVILIRIFNLVIMSSSIAWNLTIQIAFYVAYKGKMSHPSIFIASDRAWHDQQIEKRW